MQVIATHAREKEVRMKAREIDRDGKRHSFMQFKDFIQNMETFRSIDEINDKKTSKQEVGVNAVMERRGGESVRSEYFPERSNRFLGRDERQGRQGPPRASNSQRQCWRCGFNGHSDLAHVPPNSRSATTAVARDICSACASQLRSHSRTSDHGKDREATTRTTRS